MKVSVPIYMTNNFRRILISEKPLLGAKAVICYIKGLVIFVINEDTAFLSYILKQINKSYGRSFQMV